MSGKELRAFLDLADAVTDVVRSAPHGAPAGHLYAALMSVMTLERFEQFMAMLVDAGRIHKSGLLYFPGATP